MSINVSVPTVRTVVPTVVAVPQPTAVAQPVAVPQSVPQTAAAPQPTAIAVNNYQPAAVQAASTGQVSIMATLGTMFSNLVNFLKSLFGKLFGGASTAATPAPTPMPTPTPTPPPTTSGLTAAQLQVCQQEGILATPANYQAFLTEAQSIEQQNALGPGSTDTQSITELQQVLAGWGYQVTVNGQFDQATTNAVLAFKQANGLQASYVMANGAPGYNPFIDAATKQVMIKKLGG